MQRKVISLLAVLLSVAQSTRAHDTTATGKPTSQLTVAVGGGASLVSSDIRSEQELAAFFQGRPGSMWYVTGDWTKNISSSFLFAVGGEVGCRKYRIELLDLEPDYHYRPTNYSQKLRYTTWYVGANSVIGYQYNGFNSLALRGFLGPSIRIPFTGVGRETILREAENFSSIPTVMYLYRSEIGKRENAWKAEMLLSASVELLEKSTARGCWGVGVRYQSKLLARQNPISYAVAKYYDGNGAQLGQITFADTQTSVTLELSLGF